MKLLTTGYYDTEKWEPIGLVQGISVHSISLFRGMYASISGVAGGKIPEIEKKYLDARGEALAELAAEATKHGADHVIGLEVETTELNKNFVVFIAAGTAVQAKRRAAPNEVRAKHSSGHRGGKKTATPKRKPTKK